MSCSIALVDVSYLEWLFSEMIDVWNNLNVTHQSKWQMIKLRIKNNTACRETIMKSRYISLQNECKKGNLLVSKLTRIYDSWISSKEKFYFLSPTTHNNVWFVIFILYLNTQKQTVRKNLAISFFVVDRLDNVPPFYGFS